MTSPQLLPGGCVHPFGFRPDTAANGREASTGKTAPPRARAEPAVGRGYNGASQRSSCRSCFSRCQAVSTRPQVVWELRLDRLQRRPAHLRESRPMRVQPGPPACQKAAQVRVGGAPPPSSSNPRAAAFPAVHTAGSKEAPA